MNGYYGDLCTQIYEIDKSIASGKELTEYEYFIKNWSPLGFEIGLSMNREFEKGRDHLKVRLSEYDKKWIQMFEDEAGFLAGIFKDEVVNFEHFGSTSVPDMKAKPVIDMMCLVKDIEKIDLFNRDLQLLGYDVAGEWGIPGRRLFRKGGDDRTHHIHVYQYNHPQIRRHLVFRDYLRIHPDEVERYTGFKEKLAERYDETSLYSKAKAPFIKEMEQQALNWFENKGTKSSF